MNNSEMQFKDIGVDEKIILLDILGYEVNNKGLILKNGIEHKCPITGEPVFIENASILPGSIVINTSDFTLSEYLTRFVDIDNA